MMLEGAQRGGAKQAADHYTNTIDNEHVELHDIRGFVAQTVHGARQAWEGSGYRVVGAALAGKAAKGLQESSGIETRTLASYELSWSKGFNQLQKNDVLVIDEAGMIGSRQLARFVAEAKDKGAKVVLVGDAEQLQAIGAGSPFRALTREIDPASLQGIHRQKHDWQRQASMDFAGGRTRRALEAYRAKGAIHFGRNDVDAKDALVQDYLEDMITNGDQVSRLALAHRRIDVREINEAIRHLRKACGELEGERTYKTARGAREFAPGDRLLFTRNDRELDVKNGMIATVVQTERQYLTVELDTDEDTPVTVTIPVREYDAFDHGYATTIHKSQGATVDRSFVLASSTMDRHLAYVAMTRHRVEAALYADRNEFRNFEQLDSSLSRARLKQSTLDFCRCDRPGETLKQQRFMHEVTHG